MSLTKKAPEEIEWLLSEKRELLSLIKACPATSPIDRMSLESRLWYVREALGEVVDPEDEEDAVWNAFN